MHFSSYIKLCPFMKEILNLTETHGVLVRVRAGIDVIMREAIWEFQTIDPATGMFNLVPTYAKCIIVLSFLLYQLHNIIRRSTRRYFNWLPTS